MTKKLKTDITGLDQYCEDVSSGKENVCRWVKLAVERHYSDLKRSQKNDPDFPYYFEPEAAIHFFEFCLNQTHYEGSFAGQPIELEPWQQFVFGSPFGWVHKETGLRRFKELILIIPKKNGKSILGALGGLYMIDWDEEPAAQVYFMATNREHARKLSYRAAEIMADSSESLDHLTTNKSMANMRIANPDNLSFIEPLTSKPQSLDGFNVHGAINDEVKDWEANSEVYSIIADGTITRDQPMIWNITTAGTNKNSLGYERQEYIKKILKGALEDEQTFGIIYSIDEEDRDNWDDPKVWEKANPMFGKVLKQDFVKKKITQAKEDAKQKIDILTKHLDIWFDSYESYFDSEAWSDNVNPEIDTSAFKGRPCYVALDLASKFDLCSGYMMLPNGHNDKGQRCYHVTGKNWLPEKVVETRQVGRRQHYNAWADQGWFELTDGEVTDYEYIEQQVIEWNGHFNVNKLGFDPYQAAYIGNNLQKSRIKTMEIPQTVKNISEPMKTLAAWITQGRITHDGDPVLAWALSNVVAKVDKNDNVFPTKEHPDNKIDPAICLIMLVAMEMDKPLPDKRTNRKPFPIVV